MIYNKIGVAIQYKKFKLPPLPSFKKEDQHFRHHKQPQQVL